MGTPPATAPRLVRGEHRGSSLRAGALVTALALLGACAHGPPRSGRCTLPDADRWNEHRSRHFIVDVAADYRSPAHLVSVFEELQAAVLGALVAEPVEIPGRVRVVVVSSRSEVAELVGSREIAGVFWISALGEPTILVGADDIDHLPQVIAHELAHHVSFHLFPRQPWWFAEGLAQFVESVAKIDPQGRRFAGGDPTNGWFAGSVKLTPAAELLHGVGGRDDNPYVTSWILYRFLFNERSRQFSAFQQRLMEGEDPKLAWRAAFPEWDPRAGRLGPMDAELQRHQSAGRGIRWEVKPGSVDVAFTTSPASAGDLHMLLLEQRLHGTNPLVRRDVVRSVAEEVLREDPDHPLATAERARLDGTDELAALRKAAAARPDDGRAWYMLGSAAKDPAEREDALRRAVALSPDAPLAHVALASQLVSMGRPREALASANRAVDLAPAVPEAVAVLAKVAVELGRCREALLLQARAAEVAETRAVGTQQSDAKALRQQLEVYRSRCEAGPGAPR